MNKEDAWKIKSENYADAIIEYNISEEFLDIFGSTTLNYIDDKYAVLYFPITHIWENLLLDMSYSVVPSLYGLILSASIEEMGINRVRNYANLDLYGEGVLLGFVDTGIDYTSPIFQNADNTTRIVSIWDQTIDNAHISADTFYYGTEYTRDQINQAINSDDPLAVVPSTDNIGHGTTLAGLAGGTEDPANNFTGVAPSAEFVIVKLKEAKDNLKEYLCVPEDAVCYQENDIMFGIKYLVNKANSLRRPIVICLGLGSNQGGHNGLKSLADMITRIANQINVVIVIGAGNEGNAKHHYYGEPDPALGYDTVEFNVGNNDKNFLMEIWGDTPGIYSIDLTTPSGEYIPRIPARRDEHRIVSFMFDQTRITIDYILVESQTGDQLIYLKFRNTSPGIWRLRVYGGKITSGFHIWLPMRDFLSGETFFLKANPYTTITNPGNSFFAITVTAYNPEANTISPEAGRGYSRSGAIKPEIAAPGVRIYSPVLNNKYANLSGTSLAAANTVGVVALLLEWGIIRGNDRGMDSLQIKKYLIRGADRNVHETYPNQIWGYGPLNLYKTMLSLSGEI